MKSWFSYIFILLFSKISLAQNQHLCAKNKILSFQNQQKTWRANDFSKKLMEQYDVHFYFLDLHIERTSTLIDGSVTIGATILQATDTFCFELSKQLIIDSIYANQQKTNFYRNENCSYVLLDSLIPQGNQINIKIFYQGDAHIEGAAAIGSGFTVNSSNVWGDTAAFSLSQPNSAYEWFPCKQSLQDKADSAWIFVTTNQANRVGSNGILEGIDTLVATQQLKFRWKTHYPIDYYLISVAVGEYLDYTFYAHPTSLPNDSVKIINYLYRTNPNTFISLKPYLDSVSLMLEYFSDIVGLYPFYKEKYGHCMTPFGGGMEHQTMTSTEYVGNFGLLAHELFHQWFGDYVTCKSWKDIYLNEGLASYSEYLISDKLINHEAAKQRMTETHEAALKASSGSIYVPDTLDVRRIFSSELTYNKGSAVTHTLRYLLGDSLFFQSLKNFLQEYAFSTAGIEEFQKSIEKTSNINLNDFFQQWIYGEGYPIYSVEYYANHKNIYCILKQRGSSEKSLLFTTPIEFYFQSEKTDTTIIFIPTKKTDTLIIPFHEKIKHLTIDPENWILKKIDYIQENLDLITMSRNDLEYNSILLFPNPAQNEISLYNLSETPTQGAIYNIQGNLIKTFTYHKTYSIPIQNLSVGIYRIKLQNEYGETNKSFLKN